METAPFRCGFCTDEAQLPVMLWEGGRWLRICFIGDMTLVTYRRKSFSIREDDSRAPHFSLHTRPIQQVRPFGLGGFGVFSFSQFNLGQFREEFVYFSKKTQ